MHSQPRQPSLIRSAGWLIVGVVLGFALRSSVKTRAPVANEREQPPAAAALFGPADGASVQKSKHFPDALLRLRQLSASHAYLNEVMALIHELTAVECKEAIELFQTWPQAERQTIELLLARHWAKLDPENILTLQKRQQRADLYNLLVKEAGRELTERDPIGALDRLSGISDRGEKYLLAQGVLGTLAETDPTTAAEYLASHSETFAGSGYFQDVGSRLAEQSVQQALEWASSLENRNSRRMALDGVWQKSAEKDPAGTATALKASSASNRPSDNGVYGTLARSWSQIDPLATLAWIQTLPKQAQENAWQSFMPSSEQLGPEGCLKLLESVPSGRTRTYLAQNIASEISHVDTGAALHWVEQIPAGETRSAALLPVLDKWVDADPLAAVQYAAALPKETSRSDDLLARTISRWAAQDNDSALRSAKELPAGSERDVAAVRAAREVSGGTGPDAASQWLDLIENSATRREATGAIAASWVHLDASAAAAWVRQLPDADSQVQAHFEIARAWAFEDSQATAQWIGSLPSGTARDSAISAFVQSVDGYDPGLATRWAAGIEDERQRVHLVSRTYQRWLNEGDPAAARTWLESADLDEPTRGALLHVTRPKPGENAP